ncbi:MAG: hypothetical protein J1E38_04040 [Paramuribaculum sp.]|nr:hypothetical protein [Paramuribaculum sp.]
MPKEIILHDVESRREIRVNALTLRIYSDVISGDWVECNSAILKDIDSASTIEKIRNIKGTPIRWTDENGNEHYARVVEQRNVINELKISILRNNI